MSNLRDIIKQILKANGAGMSAQAISELINDRQLYFDSNGGAVSSSSIERNINRHKDHFIKKDDVIYLNTNKRLAELEQSLIKILETARGLVPIQTAYFIVGFILFLKRLLEAGELYNLSVPDNFKNYTQEYRNSLAHLGKDVVNPLTEGYEKLSQFDPKLVKLASVVKAKVSEIPAAVIFQILNVISVYRFSRENFTNDEFGIFFNNFLHRIGEVQFELGQNTTPVNLNRLLGSFFSHMKGAILDPFAGFGGTLIEVSNSNPEMSIIAYELHDTVWALGYMNLFLNNKSFNSENMNCLGIGSLFRKQVDLIVTDVPFNSKFSSSNILNFDFLTLINTTDSTSVYLQYVLQSLNETGKAVVLIPANFLFNSKPQIKNLKSKIIKNDWLDSVISLPAGALFPYTGASSAILVLDKQKKSVKNEILMIDGDDIPVYRNTGISSEHIDQIISFIQSKNIEPRGFLKNNIVRIQNKELADNDFQLVPKRYITPRITNDQIQLFEDDYVELKELLEISGSANNISVLKQGKLKSISSVDLLNSITDFKINLGVLEEIPLSNKVNLLNESALILRKDFKNLKPTYFEYEGTPILVNKGLVTFKINNNKVLVEYLISQFYTDEFLKRLDSIRRGKSLFYFSLNDFLKLKIPLPSSLEQQKIFYKQYSDIENKKRDLELETLLEELQKTRKESSSEQINIISSIQHELGNKLPALKNTFDDLKYFLLDIAKGKEIFNLNRTIRNSLPGENKNEIDTVGTLINRIERILSYTISMVDDAAGIINSDPNKYKSEKKTLLNVIKEEIERQYRGLKNIEFEYQGDKDVQIFMDIKQFGIAISNLVNNAIRHSFTNDKKIYHLAFELRSTDNINILLVKNDGNPFEITTETYIAPYKYNGPTGNSGLGGFIINQVIKNHSGSLEIIPLNEIDKADPYKAQIEIKLPKLS